LLVNVSHYACQPTLQAAYSTKRLDPEKALPSQHVYASKYVQHFMMTLYKVADLKAKYQLSFEMHAM